MVHSYSRERTLPRFKSDLSAIVSLINDLLESFGGHSPHLSFSVKNSEGEDLTFESIEELEGHKTFPAQIRSWSLYVFASDRNCSIFAHPYMTTCSAKGPTAAWSAGVVESVGDFAQRNRAWYYPFQWWMPLLAFLLGVIAIDVTDTTRLHWSVWAASSVGSIILLYMTFKFASVFPSAVIITSKEESWASKHAAELNVIAAIVSALAAILAALSR